MQKLHISSHSSVTSTKIHFDFPALFGSSFHAGSIRTRGVRAEQLTQVGEGVAAGSLFVFVIINSRKIIYLLVYFPP